MKVEAAARNEELFRTVNERMLPASTTLRESAMKPDSQHPPLLRPPYGKNEITSYRFTLAG